MASRVNLYTCGHASTGAAERTRPRGAVAEDASERMHVSEELDSVYTYQFTFVMD